MSKDVEFMTNEELILELVKRKTFMGVVIASRQELKEQNWSGATRPFRIYSKNLKAEDAAFVCANTAKQILGKR